MVKKILLAILLAGLVAVAIALPGEVWAQGPSSAQACDAIGGTWRGGECETTGTSISGIMRTVINIVSTVVGAIAVVMIVWGGFKYITAGGDSGKIASAKSTLIYAVVGLVIVALAQGIVRFVLTNV
jgi:hypothetical protein